MQKIDTLFAKKNYEYDYICDSNFGENLRDSGNRLGQTEMSYVLFPVRSRLQFFLPEEIADSGCQNNF